MSNLTEVVELLKEELTRGDYMLGYLKRPKDCCTAGQAAGFLNHLLALVMEELDPKMPHPEPINTFVCGAYRAADKELAEKGLDKEYETGNVFKMYGSNSLWGGDRNKK